MDLGALLGGTIGAAVVTIIDHFKAKRQRKPLERELLEVAGENGGSTIRMMLQRIDQRTERTDERLVRVEGDVRDLRERVDGIEVSGPPRPVSAAAQ